MANKTYQIKAGGITNWSVNGDDYIGFDTGPTLYFGECRNGYITGKDGNTYTVHATRWKDNDIYRVMYLRLDNPNISASDSYLSYTTSVFDSLTVGSITLNASQVNNRSFTVDGGVGLYWTGTYSNPFTIGSTINATLNGVNSGPYGAEFSNSSGKITLSLIDRVERFVQSGITSSIAANSSGFTSVTGMQNNDSWNVFATLNGTPAAAGGLIFNILKSSGGFTIQNNDGSSAHTYQYWVLRT